MKDDGSAGPLDGIRVIDLATSRAELAGRVLADLGAEVIKVEPPGGSPARRVPPFERGRAGDLDGSLYWAAVALGKRSVVLDIRADEDRESLRRLLAGADMLVESFDPGELDALGLGYDAVRELNPALIFISVTPWGQDGPLARQPASDLTIEAAGGLLGLQGDGDRPPVPVGYPQASFHAGVQAAADALIALNERRRSGMGQHLDVSMQAAIVWTLMNATGFPPNEGIDPPGRGDDRGQPVPSRVPGVELPPRVECGDGIVIMGLGLGHPGAVTLRGMMQWIEEEQGPLPEHLRAIDWFTAAASVIDGTLPPEPLNEAVQRVVRFVAEKTKRELMERAVRDSLLIAPLNTTADVATDRQLEARGYWHEIDGRRHPGAFARLSRTPLGPRRGAPAVGEGNALFGEAPRPAPPPAAQPRRRPAFEGIRVADFAWVGVGPLISKALADHGAVVVHVESATRPDVLRGGRPFKDGVQHPDRAQFMANFNSSKLGLALDLSTDGGREIAHRLVDWADVVVESFTPGTMERLGLHWEALSEGRPDLIMLSTCLRGQTGPERSYGGFGGQGAAIAGFHHITGWPDRAPAGPWGAYTDFIAPRFGVAALAAAIYERAESGLGQRIDLSQIEAAIHLLEPLILDYTVNGRVAPAAGHDSATSCPHGVYGTAGTERFIAIAVETADQWLALRELAPLDQFGDGSCDELDGRLRQRDGIDAALRGWCSDQDSWELAASLRAAGVPASAVQRPSDLYRDPQLAHRGFFVTLDHSVMGPTPYDGFVTRFSETPGQLRKAAPALGEDTYYVLEDLLGLSPGEIAGHTEAGVLR